MKIKINSLDAIIFDFDGVLTDNKVYVFQDGKEAVKCNRADGLGFDILRENKLPVFILSTEKNEVVKFRAEKLGVPAIHGVDNKGETLKKLVDEYKFSLKSSIKSIALFSGFSRRSLIFSIQLSSEFSLLPCCLYFQCAA